MPAAKPPDAPFRPNLYVVARFLDALARPEAPRSRADLQAAAGVNYDVFRRYLAFLVEKGYAEERADGAVRLTTAGRAVREELLAWIERFLGGEAATSGPPARGDAREARAARGPNG